MISCPVAKPEPIRNAMIATAYVRTRRKLLRSVECKCVFFCCRGLVIGINVIMYRCYTGDNNICHYGACICQDTYHVTAFSRLQICFLLLSWISHMNTFKLGMLPDISTLFMRYITLFVL